MTDPSLTFPEILKSWPKKHGQTRQWAAEQLKTPIRTYNGWCDGRPCRHEELVRLAIELIEDKISCGANSRLAPASAS